MELNPGNNHPSLKPGGTRGLGALSQERSAESNHIEVPAITLPKGGGAIRGIDEKFDVNAVNGTAVLAIPLPFSPARGLTPSHSLTYNSGAGNGIFGLGWNIDISMITRKTSKGLPQYLEGRDEDTFVLSDAEDLVPEFKKGNDGIFEEDSDGNYKINEKDDPDGGHVIRYYRPRIEGLFARIERWKHKETGIIKWRVLTRENITTLYGWSSNSRIADPGAERKVYKWLPEFIFDDKGNCTRYLYKKEDEKGLGKSLLHNRNRLKNGKITYANTYLEKVLYGNKTFYSQLGDPLPPETDFLYATCFDYGEYDTETPDQAVSDWTYRNDPFSDYKPGFEFRTTRLCRRVLLFHHFTKAGEYNGLVKSLDFTFDNGPDGDITFLTAITSCGYIKKPNNTYSKKSFPSLNFGYQGHSWKKEVQSISWENLVHAPAGLEEPQYKFADLFNEGLAGLFTEQAGGWYYKHNLGNGEFTEARLIASTPSFQGVDTLMVLSDLDADGRKQLVSQQSGYPGYFELDDSSEWQTFRAFESMPNIDFRDPNARLLDLNGDGRPDVVITEEDVIAWYPSEGRKGYAPRRQARKIQVDEEGPHLLFADSLQTIFLADMSGDGLTDLVRIRNGEVSYWPNHGHGYFGAKTSMDNAPFFDHPDVFNPSFIRLSDIDGSGTTDIIYLSKNSCSCWRNLNGNRFGTSPFVIDLFNEVHHRSRVSVIDLLGNGVSCLVWSSPLSKDLNSPLKYIDLMGSKKPHLLTSYKNNMGKQVTLEYTPSTKFYIEDKKSGRPWATKLHFPVHCISRTQTKDHISGYNFVREYNYHHGYYDQHEREFRGFAMVERTDAESFEHWVRQGANALVESDLQQEPMVSRIWHHTGSFSGNENILSQFEDGYWYREMEREGFNVTQAELELPDAKLVVAAGLDVVLINDLPADTRREAIRACKGMNLRTETFARDAKKSGDTPEARKRALTPFTVSLQNCAIELIQPKGSNQHAIFTVKSSESVTYHYERNPEDPRIAHSLNIDIDEYGNILQSAAVVYPRQVADTSLPLNTKQAQAETVIIYKENTYTNDVITNEAYRLRLPSETSTYQLKGVAKTGNYYKPSDFEEILSDTRSDPALYHETNKPLNPGRAQRRLIEQTRSTYYSNDMAAALPLHSLESLGISFESYQLAFTRELLMDIFGTKVTPDILTEGSYLEGGDSDWRIGSGRALYLEAGETGDASRDRFYTPVAYLDAMGARTGVTYYGDYFLFLEQTEDALGNVTRVDEFNFRVLSPQRLTDLNNNISATVFDELSQVKAVAVLGKGAEADELTGLTEITGIPENTEIANFFDSMDSGELIPRGKSLLQRATTRFLYNLETDMENNKPAVVAVIQREEHFHINNDPGLQMSFEYSNGHGEVIVRKTQAEPGLAKKVVQNPDFSVTISEVDTATIGNGRLRWVGSGHVVKNNKGNPVKDYEPYFSVTHHFENYKELTEAGVTPFMYYDAAGRLIRTTMPDGNFSKVIFDAWKQTIYDANDLVSDPDCNWFRERSNRLIDDKLLQAGKDPEREKQAADNTLAHAETPNVLHFDTLGRPVLSIAHSKNSDTDADEFFLTKVDLDVEGNLRSVTDARDNRVMDYKFDMLGNQLFQHSMDGGQRWLFKNIMGAPLRTWDERGHEFQYIYDPLQRLSSSKVLGGDGVQALDHFFGRIIYGEDLLLPDMSNRGAMQSRNILGQPVQQYDTGGLLDIPAYDFKGNAPVNIRRLFKKYKEVPNWTDAAIAGDLEPDSFTFTTETDALGRITRQTMPDGSILVPSYSESGRLHSETVVHPDQPNPATYIREVKYNERGQRELIRYGNNVSTRFYYDRETFRLLRLESKRQNNDPLQDLYYTYDPVGNITHIEDKNIPVEFFNNQKIIGISEYTYDPLYQLVRATGRENNAALAFGTRDNWNDSGFIHTFNPDDAMAIRNYSQTFRYDAVGNILKIKQLASGNNWTRNFTYSASNNRVLSTHIGEDPGNFDYTAYQHHNGHGYMTALPHLEDMGWNFKEELIRSVRQKVNPANGTAETTYYQYDGQGQRLRKITENASPAGNTASKKEERIYLPGYERYKKFSGPNAGLERISLSLMDEGHRFVMIETRNDIDDGTEKQLKRFQLHNHHGSSSLELDDSAMVISYEEYHPYGTTAFLAGSSVIRAAAKRYRYTGMERDEETGLAYHGARYYIPWLGRWLSCDPIGIGDSVNRYQYAQGRPISIKDPGGMCSCAENKEEPEKKDKDKKEKKKEAEGEKKESEGIFDKIKNAVSSFFGAIGQAIIAAGRWIAETAVKVWDWVKEAAGAAWNWIKEAATDAWNWIKGALETAWDWTKNAVGSAWNWIKGAASDAWDWIKNAAADAWKWMKQAAADVWNWALAPLIRTATNAFVGALPGILAGDLGWAIGGGIAGGVTGAVHGWSMAYAESYDWSSGTGWLQFLADNTWSLPNSVIGSLFATANILWNPIDKTLSKNTGQLYFKNQWFPPYDTTLPGNVTVGSVVPVHERVHTDQARYFGPFYLAFQIVWYGFWLAVFPIGIPASLIVGKNYLKCIAYNNNPFEIWAYHVEGSTSC